MLKTIREKYEILMFLVTALVASDSRVCILIFIFIVGMKCTITAKIAYRLDFCRAVFLNDFFT